MMLDNKTETLKCKDCEDFDYIVGDDSSGICIPKCKIVGANEKMCEPRLRQRCKIDV